MKRLIARVRALFQPAPAPEFINPNCACTKYSGKQPCGCNQPEECYWCAATEPCNCVQIYGERPEEEGAESWANSDALFDQSREEALERED